MRIAMLTNNYKPYVGGVPISIERLSNGLRKLGHEVYIFAPDYNVNNDNDPYVIRYRSRKKKLRNEFIVPNIFDPVIEDTFSKLSFDIIHVHHPMMMGYIAHYLGRKYRVPIIFTYHTRYEQYLHYLKPYEMLQKHCNKDSMRIIKSFERKLLYSGSEKLVAFHNRIFMKKCNLVFVPTPSMKKYLERKGTITNVEIIPTGITVDDFIYEDNEVNRIRDQYGKGKDFLFCSVSRLEKEKNISFILKGLERLKERKGDCFRLLLIGDGSHKEALEEEALLLGLQDNVTFCGRITHDELRNYYRACDLFLFASQSETQGIVLLEAMAASLSIVAVNASGVCDVIRNGINGYMTELNTEQWENSIEKIMENNELHMRMKQAATTEAKRYLSTEIAKRVEVCYRNVIAEYLRYKEYPQGVINH